MCCMGPIFAVPVLLYLLNTTKNPCFEPSFNAATEGSPLLPKPSSANLTTCAGS